MFIDKTYSALEPQQASKSNSRVTHNLNFIVWTKPLK